MQGSSRKWRRKGPGWRGCWDGLGGCSGAVGEEGEERVVGPVGAGGCAVDAHGLICLFALVASRVYRARTSTFKPQIARIHSFVPCLRLLDEKVVSPRLVPCLRSRLSGIVELSAPSRRVDSVSSVWFGPQVKDCCPHTILGLASLLVPSPAAFPFAAVDGPGSNLGWTFCDYFDAQNQSWHHRRAAHKVPEMAANENTRASDY